MSAQPGMPPMGPPQQQQEPQQPTGTPEEQHLAELSKMLEQALGGEIPGKGYLFPADPAERKSALIPVDVDQVRDQLLRSLETMAIGLQLPYGAEKKGELGKSILEVAQAYLLLDPSVDATGVPVGAAATAQAEATEGLKAQEHGQNMQAKSHEADLAARTAAHASGQAFEHPETLSGYKEPPRVKPNPAEQAIGEAAKPKEEILKGARGDMPRPKPRVGQ